MSSTLIRVVVFVGIVATLGINVLAPRIGVEHSASSAPTPMAQQSGPRLIPVPPNMR